ARMVVGGNLEFTNVTATNPRWSKNFSGLRADNLIFDDTNIASPFYLNGMSYRLISCDITQADQNTQKDNLLPFINKAEYSLDNPDVYMNVEAFYQKEGNIEAAKEVHIDWKKRERSTLGFIHHPLAYVWNIIDWVSVGYGQRVARALWWSAGFIALGWLVVFRK